MPGLVTIQISTDGSRDYVDFNGIRHVVPAISMASLVGQVATNVREAREALDAFNEGRSGRLAVDPARLAEVLVPKPKRVWSAASPFIPEGKRSSQRDGTMVDTDKVMKDAISQQVAHIEKQVALLNSNMKDSGNGSISHAMMADEIKKLRDLASWLQSPSPYGDQSKNKTYYGLPSSKLANDEQSQGQEQAQEQQGKSKEASFDVFASNRKVADETLEAVTEAADRIDHLVSAGKKFNHDKARADLYKVASRVGEITASVDLGYAWIGKDLSDLHARAIELRDLFPAK